MKEPRFGRGRTDGVSPSRALAALALAALISFALSLTIRSGFAQEGAPEPPAPELNVEWALEPGSLGELVSHTQALVVARVEGVRAGAPIGDAVQSTPTQRINLQVERGLAGRVPAQFTLFKLGGEGLQPAGAPDYQVGERYLLFVRRRLDDELSTPHPDGTWILSAPDGRLRVLSTGRLDPMIQGPVARDLDGATPDEAAGEADGTNASFASGPVEAER